MTTPRSEAVDPITPLFLFSLPRAGSTLVQRVLGADAAIATVSEPWILLPLLYARRSEGAFAEYGHRMSVAAIDDFNARLARGEDSYREAAARFVQELYGAAARPGARYFLDKTPRYHLVVDEIVDLFPNAKLVFLWRNPLAVAASMLESFGHGHWNLYQYRIDLFTGLANLLDARDRLGKRAFSVRYEDLVSAESGRHWEALFEYLGLTFDPSVLDRFAGVALNGRFGDPTGVKRYASLSSEPLQKWREIMGNPARQAWCRRYLDWIGPERLARMGYDGDTLRHDLDTVPWTCLKRLPDDVVRMAYGSVFEVAEPVILRQKVRSVWHGRDQHAHF